MEKTPDFNAMQASRNGQYRPLTIMTAEDNVGQRQYLSNDRGVMDDRRPTFYGMAGANELVILYAGAAVIGSVQANASGEWFLEISEELNNGRNVITAHTETSRSDPFFVNIQAPTPAIKLVAQTQSGEALENGGLVSGMPTFSGTVEPGAVVHLTYKLPTHDISVIVKADENGYWEQTPDFLPIDKILTTDLTVHANSGTSVTPPFTVKINPHASTVIPPEETVESNIPLIEGAYQYFVGRTVASGETVSSEPAFFGKAEPFTRVTLSFNRIDEPLSGFILNNTFTNANGEWRIEPRKLPPGFIDRDIEFYIVSGDQRSEPFIIKIDYSYIHPETPVEPEVPVTPVEPVEPEIPEVPVRIYQALDKYGIPKHLHDGNITDDANPIFFGSATQGQIVILYSGSAILGSTVADENGEWEFQITEPLSSGLNEIIAKSGELQSEGFTLELILPEYAPVIITHALDNVDDTQRLENGEGNTDDAYPTFVGIAGPGVIVTLYNGGILLGSSRADMTGRWELEIGTPLNAGANRVTAFTAGTESSTFVVNLIIAEVVPEVPVTISWVLDDVGQPQLMSGSNGRTDDALPTFYGKAGAGELVQLLNDGNLIGSATVDSQGNWIVQTILPLTVGINEIVATTGGLQNGVFNIDFVPAVVPVTINWALDDVDMPQLLQSGVGKTDDNRPTFSGQAASGEMVTLFAGSVVVGSTVADAAGNWTLEITKALENGEHAIVARSGSQQSAPFLVNVEVAVVEPEEPAIPVEPEVPVKPEEPTIPVEPEVPVEPEKPTIPVEPEVPVNPPVPGTPVVINYIADYVGKRLLGNDDPQSDKTTGDRRPTFMGTAGAGELVTLYSGEFVIGSAVANNFGQWTIEDGNPLVSGTHNVMAKTVTQQSAISEIIVLLPQYAPVLINNAFDNIGDQYMQQSGGASFDDDRPSFSGFAGDGEVVTLYHGDIILGTTVANERGYWQLEITTSLNVGASEIVAKTATQQSNTFVVNLHASEDEPIRIRWVLDDAGEEILDGVGSTNNTTPTLHGIGGVGQVVSLFNGNVLLGTTVVKENGQWSFEIITPLSEGWQGVLAKTANYETPQFWIVVDAPTTQPEIPTEPAVPEDVPVTIDSVHDNYRKHQELISGVTATDDANPVFSGTARASDVVTLFSGNKVLGSTVANEQGKWSFEIPEQLNSGYNNVIATTATQESQGFELSLQHSSARITIGGLSYEPDMSGEFITAGVSGTAQEGMLITLYSGEQILGSTIARGGYWHINVEMHQSGTYPLSATSFGLDSLFSRFNTLHIELPKDVPVKIMWAIHDDGAYINLSDADNATLTSASTIGGRAGAGMLVTLYNGETLLGSTITTASGTWNIDLIDNLPYGLNTLVARTEMLESGVFIVNVDSQPEMLNDSLETATGLTVGYFNAATGEPVTEGEALSSPPTLQGTANPGEKIMAHMKTGHGAYISATYADDQGNWTIYPPANLSGESIQVVVRTLGTDEYSDTFLVTVDPTLISSFNSASAYSDLLIDDEANLFGVSAALLPATILPFSITPGDWVVGENMQSGLSVEVRESSSRLLDDENYLGT